MTARQISLNSPSYGTCILSGDGGVVVCGVAVFIVRSPWFKVHC